MTFPVGFSSQVLSHLPVLRILIDTFKRREAISDHTNLTSLLTVTVSSNHDIPSRLFESSLVTSPCVENLDWYLQKERGHFRSHQLDIFANCNCLLKPWHSQSALRVKSCHISLCWEFWLIPSKGERRLIAVLSINVKRMFIDMLNYELEMPAN